MNQQGKAMGILLTPVMKGLLLDFSSTLYKVGLLFTQVKCPAAPSLMAKMKLVHKMLLEKHNSAQSEQSEEFKFTSKHHWTVVTETLHFIEGQ